MRARQRAEVTLVSVNCSDSGIYECVANGSSSVGRDSAVLHVKKNPDNLTLEVPLIAEGVTSINPICRTTSQGYNPIMTFRWVLKQPDGTEESLSHSVQTDVTVTTCTVSSSSTLDSGSYTGWNNTDLCCQLTDPKNCSDVVMESCTKIMTLPGDYCPSGNDTYLMYPFEPCYTYVQCAGTTINFGHCPKSNSSCFDLTTGSCPMISTISIPYYEDATPQPTLPEYCQSTLQPSLNTT